MILANCNSKASTAIVSEVKHPRREAKCGKHPNPYGRSDVVPYLVTSRASGVCPSRLRDHVQRPLLDFRKQDRSFQMPDGYRPPRRWHHRQPNLGQVMFKL